MSDDARQTLRAGLEALGFGPTATLVSALIQFSELVLSENQKTNLTGARDLRAFVTEQVLDSLAPLPRLRLGSPVVDLGSGAGLPGVPAALVHPELEFVLIEPRQKRFEFLNLAKERLGLENVLVVKSSASGPAAKRLRGKARVVLMRAVADPERSIEAGLALVQLGGVLALYEGRAARPTAAQRRRAWTAGRGRIEVVAVHVPGLDAQRHLWTVRKGPLDQGKSSRKVLR